MKEETKRQVAELGKIVDSIVMQFHFKSANTQPMNECIKNLDDKQRGVFNSYGNNINLT